MLANPSLAAYLCTLNAAPTLPYQSNCPGYMYIYMYMYIKIEENKLTQFIVETLRLGI